ncbi:uncharacterized protein LOC115308924 [Ixodes scapularis]|uniref:uncharacterized protein LOC115308924 n=1 Tax=Ixodes scapularis TaxID=6945 RepID=UPI001A9DD1E8|nr:uncharacterized protein LOC115308924 [Ixodes scapularis]
MRRRQKLCHVSKLTALLIRIDVIEKTLETQTGKGDELMSKIENQGRTIEGIEESINTQSARHQERISRLDSQDKTIKGLEQTMNQLEEEITQRDEETWALRKAVDNAEQYSRRQNIEIHGVTQRPNERLLEVINDIATKLDVPPLAITDVEVAHRLRAEEGRPAPILVRFTERRTRDVWAKKRASLTSENIYINENLTRAIKNLLWTKKYTCIMGTWLTKMYLHPAATSCLFKGCMQLVIHEGSGEEVLNSSCKICPK